MAGIGRVNGPWSSRQPEPLDQPGSGQRIVVIATKAAGDRAVRIVLDLHQRGQGHAGRLAKLSSA